MTAVDNAGLKVSNTAKEIVTGKPTPSHMKVKFKPKTDKEINKETVQKVQQIREMPKKAAATGANVALQVYHTPGAVLDEGIKFASKNPIAAAGQGGSVVLPILNPAFLGIPVGSPSVAINAAAKKWKPYDRVTERMSNAYGRSSFSQGLRAMPTLPEVATQVGRAVFV